MKPRTTFTTFIQPPLFGAFFSMVGKSAKSVKGRASAMAKPNIPIVGLRIEPPAVDTSTSKNPMIGPVQEKLTRVSVNAIKKSPMKPDALLARAFTLLFQLEGSVISKPPKKLAAKTTSKRNRKILNTAFVLKSFKVLALDSEVTMRPRDT